MKIVFRPASVFTLKQSYLVLGAHRWVVWAVAVHCFVVVLFDFVSCSLGGGGGASHGIQTIKMGYNHFEGLRTLGTEG